MRRTFIKILRRNKALDKKAARLLGQAVEEHPYSQPLRMLYAKALMNVNHSGFEGEVNKAVACAPDRRVFRAYLSGAQFLGHPFPSRPPAAQTKAGIPEGKEAAGRDRNKVTSQQAIIARFLQQPQQLSRNPESIPEGELSRESIEDHPDLVSETLATVLEKQGKTNRAIAIYNKLSLKFPEKSSYFAKKIESIQQETNKIQ